MSHRKLRSDFDGKIAGLYDLEETIGEGHFAVVKLARHVFTGEKVAVKVIDKTKLDEISKAHLFQEVRCMKLVQHPNVVRLYEVIDTQTKLYLILELGDGGDLYDYIMKHERGIEEVKARHYYRQIVEAISYCHKLHVVHRDLKPENVVFFKKLEIVKLTDFGFSNMFNPGNKLETSCGSLAYSAPEILLGDSYDAQAVDIWSLGVILFMLVCGEPPFQEANDSETLTMILDCKYEFPGHVSDECRDLISQMLCREPSNRANLELIENHEWLQMDGEDSVPHYHSQPLVSKEQVSVEDHTGVVEKMVEGCIAGKDEILQSLERDMYNHITATYYLLVERRLKKHRADMANQAAMLQLRKHSLPSVSHTKPHLEPLALSPRKQREIKKTKTAPVNKNQLPGIAESPTAEEYPASDARLDYFKSLTTSQTLDRRAKHKVHRQPAAAGGIKAPISPQTASPRLIRPPLNRSMPEITEQVHPNKQKKPRAFSKIAILSSFFEQKIAALSASASSKGRSWRFPGFRKKSESPQIKEAESADDLRHQLQQKQSLVKSLLSPQGIHPTTSSTLRESNSSIRKCSLIQEESLDEVSEDDEDLEIETYTEKIRTSKSAENLDVEDNYSSHNSSPVVETEQQNVFMKRPLLSVASSPQLLNQICEENESEEEDDFVPPKLNASRIITQRNSLASPEVIRKYEARRKHRATGSRGTSCSSSDASDTDDTEGRSRKDKLKHKFIHRRDSSDHSSDTDGGPSGHGGGGFGRGLGGEGSGGGGPSRDKDDRGGGGGSGGKRDGKGGSPKNGRHHGRGKQNHLSFKLGGEVILNHKSSRNDTGVKSTVSNLSLASVVSSRSSLKYVIERDENVSDSDLEDNDQNENEAKVDVKKLRETLIERLSQENIHVNKSRSNRSQTPDSNDSDNFSSINDETAKELNKFIIARCSPGCDMNGRNKQQKQIKQIKKDINSNSMLCIPTCQGEAEHMKVETKCCSLV